MEKLSSLKNIIREGRIEKIEKDKIVFKNGTQLPTDCDTLHIDCSSNGLLFKPLKPIFAGSVINLQMVQAVQPAFSGSVIAAIELALPDDDEDKKNEILTPIPSYQTTQDWLQITKQSLLNAEKFGQALGGRWLRNSRLSFLYHMSLWEFGYMLYWMFGHKDAVMSNIDRLYSETDDKKYASSNP